MGNGALPLFGNVMTPRLFYAVVRDSARQPIHVIRVHEVLLEPTEIDDLAERLRERLHARGEVTADIVMVQGSTKETLRLFGNSYAVTRVRAAMFNATISWSPIDL